MRYLNAPKVLPLILIAGVLGCAPDRDVSPDLATEVTRTTHPELGVPLVVSSAGLAARALGWTLSAEPDLVLGALKGGAEAELFISVIGARQRHDGTLFVLDNRAGELRMFDPDGQHLRTLGGPGDGPTEFGTPRLIQSADPSEIVVWDRQHRRTIQYGETGEVVETLSLHGIEGDAIGAVGDTVLSRQAVFVTVREPGVSHWPVRYLAYDQHTLDSVIVDETTTPWWITEASDGSPASISEQLFGARPLAAMHLNGLVIVRGADPELRLHRPDGSVMRVQRVQLPREPVTWEAIEGFLRGQAEIRRVEFRDEWLDGYRDLPLPDRIPAFDELLVDSEGHIWARSFRRDPGTATDRWLVFAPGGELLGGIDLPAELEVYQIGTDFVLGKTEDDLDVQRVERYRLTR